jgi:hypothetical protein
VAKTRKEIAEEIRKRISRRARPIEGREAYDFNIKIYKIDIPKGVRTIQKKTEEQIGSVVDHEMAAKLSETVHVLGEEYRWISGWEQGGRSGGWLVLWTEWPVLDERGEIEPGCLGLARARASDLAKIEKEVEKGKRELVEMLEDPQFWGLSPIDWSPRK